MELYDHRTDPDELLNLALEEDTRLRDSLLTVLDRRWRGATGVPDGIGRQVKDPPVAEKTPHLTHGDVHSLDGSIEIWKEE